MASKAVWLRVNPQVRQFVLGEVERQHHLIGTWDFKTRVEWMTDAWDWALNQSIFYDKPDVQDMLHIAAMIEPELNIHGYRETSVWIGDHQAVGWYTIPHLVAELWDTITHVKPTQGKGKVLQTPIVGSKGHFAEWTADDFYLEFERIHPFRDGNGRTGKVIHNWLLGRLSDPVLIFDYFGGGNP